MYNIIEEKGKALNHDYLPKFINNSKEILKREPLLCQYTAINPKKVTPANSSVEECALCIQKPRVRIPAGTIKKYSFNILLDKYNVSTLNRFSS